MNPGTLLYDHDGHRCVAFSGLVRGDDGVQANQFLIQDDGESAILDPGGALLYNPLVLALAGYMRPHEMRWVLCTHQDPDIIGSVDKWMLYSQATIVSSRLWGRFIPHVVPGYMKNAGADRYLLLPDAGGPIPLGRGQLHAVPGHFMHSVGNFGFYDPVSGILFSGDIGASMVASDHPYTFVTDFAAHRPRMEGFHRRYMGSNRVLRLWVAMVRQIAPRMIVPQHGLPLKDAAIPAFLDWLEQLQCGIDLMGPADYRWPPA